MPESDTRANYIDPALATSGWDRTQIFREYYFTDGRKLAGKKRGSRCFADYLLHQKNHHLALIEAKKRDPHPTDGLQQVIDYAQKLRIRFIYSSNGEEIFEMDLETGKGDYIDCYPSPSDLLARHDRQTDVVQVLRAPPFHLESGNTPRYYQELAVHAATDALSSGQQRILLTLATGTGKTFIAFQIVHKLFQARWSRGELGSRRPRILFLADLGMAYAKAQISAFNPLPKEGNVFLSVNDRDKPRAAEIARELADLGFKIHSTSAAAYKNPKDNPDQPNVLIIGDSISAGYTVPVRLKLKGKANVFRIKGNGKNSAYGLANLGKWIGNRHWDLIHFNWGLWDLCYRHPESKTQGHRDKIKGTITESPEQYQANLEKIVARLKKTDAKLIWCNTTPVPEFEADRKLGDDLFYNKIAAKIMKENKIPINDFHAHALLKQDEIQKQ